MAESHGWTVSVDPDYGSGARFEFVTVGNEHDRDRNRMPATVEPDTRPSIPGGVATESEDVR
jgi:hypothetical protein